MIVTLLVFAGSILLLIGFHEAGHFFAAKALGVYVIEFAIGFGPKLASVKGRETRYTLRAVPFGGYVRMAGEDRRETDREIPPDRCLYGKPPWVRAVISLAGPLVNLFLAFVLMVAVIWSVQLPVFQVAKVISESPAAEAFELGDRILAIEGDPIYLMDQITNAIQRSEGEPLSVEIRRAGSEEAQIVTLVPEYEEDAGRFMIGAYFASAARTSEVRGIDPGARLAGSDLRPGDRIIAVEGTPTETYVDLVLALEEDLPAASLSATVRRGDEVLTLSLAAEDASAEELLEGVEFADFGLEARRPGFVSGLALGSGQFALYVTLLGDLVGGIITGRVAAGEAIRGPVGVAELLGESVRVGAEYFFQVLAFLSLNFGLLNLIPFPGLDGSRVVFVLYEAIRGRAIPVEREGLIHAIGFLILIGLMVLITFKDLVALFR